jgi:hypothetical protein
MKIRIFELKFSFSLRLLDYRDRETSTTARPFAMTAQAKKDRFASDSIAMWKNAPASAIPCFPGWIIG